MTRLESSVTFCLQDCGNYTKDYRTSVYRGGETHKVCGGNANGVGDMKPFELQHGDVIDLLPRKYTPGTGGNKETIEDCFDFRFKFEVSENLQAEMKQWQHVAEENERRPRVLLGRDAMEREDAVPRLHEGAVEKEPAAPPDGDDPGTGAPSQTGSPPRRTTLKLVIDDTYIGDVIGKAGENRKRIVEESDCTITISKKHRYHPLALVSGGRTISITGLRDKVAVAVEMIVTQAHLTSSRDSRL